VGFLSFDFGFWIGRKRRARTPGVKDFSSIKTQNSKLKNLPLALLIAAFLLIPTLARAADDAPAFVEITPESQACVDKGLTYLATLQAKDGSFGNDRSGQTVGVTALACLAFMAHGDLPGRGTYGPQVEKGLDYILRNVQETGLIAGDVSQGPMYGHGFGMLFLGEIYGMTGDRRVREALVKAVRLTVSTQNAEGGWRYHPVPFDADISVTITQIMGLRSARNAGLSVPKETIDRAIVYVRQCQNPSDGGFRYMLNAGGSAFPRSAAGVASLYYAGVYQDDALKRGLDYLLRQRPDMSNRGGGHYFYGHYYAVQAMFLAGGKYWAQWFPSIRQELIKQQQANGGWTSEHGEEYGSAMSLLILQIPNRFLPIFQR
jgi:hypothetical protein